MQFPPAGPLGPMGPPHMAGPPPRMVGAFQSNNAFNQNPRKRPLSQRLGTTNSNNVNGGQKKGKWTGPSRTGPNNAGQQGNNAAVSICSVILLIMSLRHFYAQLCNATMAFCSATFFNKSAHKCMCVGKYIRY